MPSNYNFQSFIVENSVSDKLLRLVPKTSVKKIGLQSLFRNAEKVGFKPRRWNQSSTAIVIQDSEGDFERLDEMVTQDLKTRNTEIVLQVLSGSGLWDVRLDGSRIQLYAVEPFLHDTNFVYHSTGTVANKVFKGFETTNWGGLSGTHVSIPLSATEDQVAGLCTGVRCKVAGEQQRINAILEELTRVDENGIQLVAGFESHIHGLNLKPVELLANAYLEKHDYWTWNVATVMRREIEKLFVEKPWLCPRQEVRSLIIPSYFTLEQAKQLRISTLNTLRKEVDILIMKHQSAVVEFTFPLDAIKKAMNRNVYISSVIQLNVEELKSCVSDSWKAFEKIQHHLEALISLRELQLKIR